MGYGAADRWTEARPKGRAAGSWNRRGVNVNARGVAHKSTGGTLQTLPEPVDPVGYPSNNF
jgi:hypothetical protein